MVTGVEAVYLWFLMTNINKTKTGINVDDKTTRDRPCILTNFATKIIETEKNLSVGGTT